MPKKNRLTGRDMRGTRPTQRLHGAIFSLSLLPLSSGPARVTFVVSKAVAAHAVDRNLIKRRARAALPRSLDGLSSVGLVFTAKKSAVSANAASIRADILALVAKIPRA